ncbi:hypothetical protein BDV26DRAFT_279569 [Aspergillus bertholletiae]|uniref:NAD(P)-binding domain-containing protein n=1 Tax=Aspergillus bertholletiae TaxID=1226010 RepID=A0A5N7BF43_9EURO|nr:hypothetical protein BDV26DRAFT_279569 [Aspergillus bertholletiae]
MHFLVLGATGHRLSLLVRNPSNLPRNIVENTDVQVIEGTLDEEVTLDSAASCGASIFVSFAGPPFGTTGTPLTLGYKALVPKLIDQNFERILVLCTPSFHDVADTATFKWWLGVWFMRLFSTGQYQEMVGIGEYLSSLPVNQDVQWTLFRVGGLTDAEAAPVKATSLGSGDDGTWISRASVATWVLDEITQEKWLGKAPYISGPPCGYCTARKADCRYATVGLFRYSEWSEQCQHPPTSSTCGVNQSKKSDGSRINQTLTTEASHSTLATVRRGRMRELQLMHVWSMKTCHSFSSDLSGVFQSFVVEQAFQHPFLMDSLLALASLHIASGTTSSNENHGNHSHGTLDSATVSEYIEDALHYQNSAVPVFCDTLKNISPSNCDALFACSVIMMACAVVAPFMGSRRGTARENLTSPFHFVKGIHSVIDKSRPWLTRGPFQFAILTHPDDEWESSQDSELVHKLRAFCSHVDPTQQKIYTRAITLLGNCSVEGRTMAIPWIVVVGKDLVDLVQQGEPLALLIYMHWGVLLSRLKDVWWASLSGRRIVADLAKELAQVGEWAEAIQLAVEEVGLNMEEVA